MYMVEFSHFVHQGIWGMSIKDPGLVRGAQRIASKTGQTWSNAICNWLNSILKSEPLHNWQVLRGVEEDGANSLYYHSLHLVDQCIVWNAWHHRAWLSRRQQSISISLLDHLSYTAKKGLQLHAKVWNLLWTFFFHGLPGTNCQTYLPFFPWKMSIYRKEVDRLQTFYNSWRHLWRRWKT